MSARAIVEAPGVRPLVSLLVLLALWQAGAVAAGLSFLPPPTTVFRAIPGILADADALGDIAASLRRLVIGFAFGLVFAVPLGLVMGRSAAVNGFVNPILVATYPIPKAALIPIIMVWFGVGDISKIVVIFLGVSLPLIYHSYHGSRRVDEKLVWSAAAMGTGRIKQIFFILLPSALPDILLGCRVAIAMGLIVMVSSEMIARQSGVGNLLFNSLDMALYELTYAMIVLIAAIGFAIDVAFEAVRRRLTFWAVSRSSNVAVPT